jgi:hypothetical protein
LDDCFRQCLHCTVQEIEPGRIDTGSAEIRSVSKSTHCLKRAAFTFGSSHENILYMTNSESIAIFLADFYALSTSASLDCALVA